MRLLAGIVAIVLAAGCTPGSLDTEQNLGSGGSGGGSGGSGGSHVDAPGFDMPDAEPPDTLPFCGGGDANASNPADGNCFMFFATPKSWYDAFLACSALGTNVHLATLTDANQDTIARGLNGQTGAWIGYDDRTVEGQFNWITSEVSGYTNWATGQPNNGGGGTPQNCVILDPTLTNQWNDKSCDQLFGYICERDGAIR